MASGNKNELFKSRPGFLSEIDSFNRFLYEIHPPKLEELQTVRDVLGDRFTAHLADLHAPLYVFNGQSGLNTISYQSEERGSNTHSFFHKYRRTNYASIIDGWIVFINTWKSNASSKFRPNKAARFDFMLLDDWMNEDNFRLANTKKLKADVRSAGLFTRGSSVLRKIQSLVLSVPEDCRIDIYSANLQREKIYRKMVMNHNNIIVHKNYEDAASPLTKLIRRLNQ